MREQRARAQQVVAVEAARPASSRSARRSPRCPRGPRPRARARSTRCPRRGRARRAHGVVGKGEARVRADHAPGQRRGPAGQEGAVLRRCRRRGSRGRCGRWSRSRAPSAGPPPRRAARTTASDPRTNAGEEWWSMSMVVPRPRGVDGADGRRQADRALVERAVEPPPDLLQDLHEPARRRRRPGHAAGQRAVEVRVGVDEAGEDQAPGGVDDFAAFQPAAALDDAVVLDAQVRGLDARRVQFDERRAPQQHEGIMGGRSGCW